MGHRALRKVANERYCYIFLIFVVGIAITGTGNRHWRRQIFFFNNSALGGHRALRKVANERYCYIFFIFGVGIAGTGNWHRRRQKKNLKKKKLKKKIEFFF